MEMDFMRDPQLVRLVDFINRMEVDIEIPFTVVAAGGIVTGRLVSAADWWQRQAVYFETTSLSPLGESYREISMDLMAERDNALKIFKAGLIPQTSDPHHVHLADARYVQGNPMWLDTEGTLWRGRISSISGWSFGEKVLKM